MEDLPQINGRGTGQSYGFIRYVQTIKVNKHEPSIEIKGPIRDILILLLDGVRQTSVFHDPIQVNDFGFWGSRYE